MALPQEKYYTYADLLDWPEEEQVELISGKIFMMSSPMRKHQKISGALFAQLYNYLAGKTCEVYHAPFGVRLFEKKGDKPYSVDTYVVPDISVICDPDKLDDYGCAGAPDMIVEILSPSTQRTDRLLKFNLYKKAGVKEYWIVDPDRKTVMVMTLEDGEYHAPVAYSSDAVVPVGVLEDCRIDLNTVFEGI